MSEPKDPKAVPQLMVDLRPTLEQAQEQIHAMRKAANLPVPSLDERLRMRGVPERLIEEIVHAKLQPNEATRLAFRLVEEGGLLVLAGEPGRGKTTAAAWALSECPGIFVRSEQLGVLDETGALEARMRSARLLVVDDLGAEHSPGGYAAGRLDAVVEYRWSNLRRTLLTTNLAGPVFVERYGARIKSRVNAKENEARGLGWVDLDGPDLRLAASP